jgi:DeoR/GlpR family transcriptional regulator of sugar metabolism
MSLPPLNSRQNDILSLARTVGRVEVDALATRFDVTPQTIRRDLNDLCDRNILARTHGGAIVSSSFENLSYEARHQIASVSKRAIGIAAAELIPDNSSLFITVGTTTEEVAKSVRSSQRAAYNYKQHQRRPNALSPPVVQGDRGGRSCATCRRSNGWRGHD